MTRLRAFPALACWSFRDLDAHGSPAKTPGRMCYNSPTVTGCAHFLFADGSKVVRFARYRRRGTSAEEWNMRLAAKERRVVEEFKKKLEEEYPEELLRLTLFGS